MPIVEEVVLRTSVDDSLLSGADELSEIDVYPGGDDEERVVDIPIAEEVEVSLLYGTDELVGVDE